MSKYIKALNEYSLINNIKYTEKIKKYKISSNISIDWKNVLAKPPENNSDTTKKELEYLQKLTSKISSDDIRFIHEIDKDPRLPFLDVLKKINLSFPHKEFNKAYSILKPIILNIKYIHNRPRPFQLAEVMGYKINVIKTDTINTPSYPSGHTSYAALCAYLLAAMYPEHSGHFFDRVAIVGETRMMQGVHYPSDNEASMVITGAIWEDIRYRLFPKLKNF